MSSASPGPWRWVPDDQWFVLVDSDGRPLEIETTEANGRCRPEDRTMISLAPEMAAMLRQLEWADVVVSANGAVATCAQCHAFKDGGYHLPWCKLGALLARLP